MKVSAHSSGLKFVNMVYKNASYIKFSNTLPPLPQPTLCTPRCLRPLTSLSRGLRCKSIIHNSGQRDAEDFWRKMPVTRRHLDILSNIRAGGKGRKCLISFLIIRFWPMPSTATLEFWLMSLTRKQTIGMLNIKTYKWLGRRKLPVLISLFIREADAECMASPKPLHLIPSRNI